MRRAGGPLFGMLLGACGFTSSTGTPADSAAASADARLIDARLVDALPADAAVDAPPGCVDNDVTASKSYFPVTSTNDGSLTVNATYPKLVVPGALSVVVGNAGNHCAQLVFKHSGTNQTVRCRYQGGADVSHVGLNPFQIAKGLRYELDGCAQGAACPTLNGTPETVTAGMMVLVTETITIHVDNGDNQAGPTIITQPIRMCQ